MEVPTARVAAPRRLAGPVGEQMAASGHAAAWPDPFWEVPSSGAVTCSGMEHSCFLSTDAARHTTAPATGWS
jgi:hypothetical protein